MCARIHGVMAGAAALAAVAACRAPAAVGPTPPGAAMPAAVSSPSTIPALAVPGTAPLDAAEVDHLLERAWADAGVTPGPPCDDAQFLRRATLDLAGRVPTLDEAEAFLAARNSDRRAALVDRLLASAEHAEAWADVYVNLFVGRQFRKPGLEQRLDPRAYFVDAFRENRPYDRVATELLTFTGELQPRGPGAFLASQLRAGGAEAAAAATARLFLGVQLQCAQCHDHPADRRYRQEDFHGLAASFARTRATSTAPDARAEMTMGVADGEGDSAPVEGPSDEGGRTLKPTRRPRVYSVLERLRGEAVATFRRPDAPDAHTVGPSFLGRVVPARGGETARQTLARAVVGSDLFAKAMVERTWAQLFGSGLVQPWDDLGGEHDPRHPLLLERLAADFRATGHDVRRLVRTLVSTRAYALSARTQPPLSGAPAPSSTPDLDAPAAAPNSPLARFARGTVRRLTPEQLFRSLLTATGLEGMQRPAGEPMERKLARLLREHLFVFADDERAEVVTFDGNVPQALMLWNGELVNQGARARPGGVLARILAETPQPASRLDRLFLASLSRLPTPAERARLVTVVATPGAGRRAYEDVFFALLTCTEMSTNH